MTTNDCNLIELIEAWRWLTPFQKCRIMWIIRLALARQWIMSTAGHWWKAITSWGRGL